MIRVTSWIVFFITPEKSIHELTQNNTNA